MDGPRIATVTMASMDTLTDGVRQGIHSWMVHGWSVTVTIHGWSMDGHSNYGIHGYFDRRG